MEELRLRWLEDIENELKCNASCNGKLRNNVHMCLVGHNICELCYHTSISSRRCQICGTQFTQTRNFLAEQLLDMTEKIQVALRSIGFVNETSNLEKSCTAVQTDFDPLFCKIKNTKPSPAPPSVSGAITDKKHDSIKGSFPCLIGSLCSIKRSYPGILEHFKTAHPSCFTEYPGEVLPFTTSWEFMYHFNRRYDRAFFIPKVGLFLLHVRIENEGSLKGYIAMYNNERTISNRCKIRFVLGLKILEFDLSAVCSRLWVPTLYENGFRIDGNVDIEPRLLRGLSFECSVTVTKERNFNSQFVLQKKNENRRINLKQSDDNGSKNSLNSMKSLEQDMEKASGTSVNIRTKNQRFARARVNQRAPRKSSNNAAQGAKKQDESSSVDSLVDSLTAIDDETLTKLRMSIAQIEMDRLAKKSTSRK